MLYDDAVLLTYDVSNRFIISMFPSMEISRLMIDKMMALKSIIFRLTLTMRHPSWIFLFFGGRIVTFAPV